MEEKKMNIPDTISMYAHEEAICRMERQSKRLFIALVVSIILLFASNMGWLIYESMYDTISYAQDGAGINNINTGKQGDVLNEPDTEATDSKE